MPLQKNNIVNALLAHTAIVVPVLNAGSFAMRFIKCLQSQNVDLARILVLDSDSTDGSHARFAAAGFEVVGVHRRDFDHGATRNLAFALAPEADFIVYLTQDAILQPDSIRRLLLPFLDSTVGLAYGRQLPRAEARAIERHARLFNYPTVSARRSIASISGEGIKAVFNSNSFAAYRRKALEEIGRFPEHVIFGEDQLAAARILLAGWTVCYEASAEVIHSHGLSVITEFRRYFDHGVTHARNGWLHENFGTASAAGVRFVASELAYLYREEPLSIPEACIRTSLKYAGYRLGRNESWLPRSIKRHLSLQGRFFTTKFETR